MNFQVFFGVGEANSRIGRFAGDWFGFADNDGGNTNGNDNGSGSGDDDGTGTDGDDDTIGNRGAGNDTGSGGNADPPPFFFDRM